MTGLMKSRPSLIFRKQWPERFAHFVVLREKSRRVAFHKSKSIREWRVIGAHPGMFAQKGMLNGCEITLDALPLLDIHHESFLHDILKQSCRLNIC
ncbi:hypothetical protein CDAR_468801 [Caerostris darwini]|uniref:Uncharacterized protein n=1 Tax=Caerostris darwini TaxID=1538125 RepID=A0AAV4T4N9_9ARAC|nr:hypothetical protein CDAR_468801 [Caerostris darwini]